MQKGGRKWTKKLSLKAKSVLAVSRQGPQHSYLITPMPSFPLWYKGVAPTFPQITLRIPWLAQDQCQNQNLDSSRVFYKPGFVVQVRMRETDGYGVVVDGATSLAYLPKIVVSNPGLE